MAFMSILFAVFFSLLIIAVIVSLFTYSFFWYENSGHVRRREIEDSGKSLPKLLIQGMVSGIGGIFILVASFPLGFIRSLWRPKTISSAQPVVVLVHGLYHNASAWLLLRYRLKKAGFTNVFVANYSSFFTSFEDCVRKLERFIRRCRLSGSGQPLIIIGHSLGGLLARVYAERSEGDDSPAAVITLGTPHKGSRMAAFGIGALAGSLMYDGPLFQSLKAERRKMPYAGFSLFSPADSLVLPSEGLVAPPEWVRYETPPVSHVSMLYSPKIARKIIEIIKK